MKFEDYLQKKYGKMGTYKDSDKDMAAFGEWLLQLDPQEWLDYAEAWGVELAREVRDITLNEWNNSMR